MRNARRVLEKHEQPRGEELGDINFKSPVEHHYHESPRHPQQQKPGGIMRWLGPLLISTALGGGLGGAGYLIAQAIKNRPQSGPVTVEKQNPVEDTDTDTIFNLELVD